MPLGIPLLKLIPLGWKFVTKPIESGFKAYIKRSPKFKTKAISIGETYNYYTVMLRYKMNGVTRTPEQIMKMSKVHEGKAMDIACDVATNFVSTGLALIFLGVWQLYQDQIDEEKKQAKAARRKQKDQRVQQQIAELQVLKEEVSSNKKYVVDMVEALNNQQIIINAQQALIDDTLERLSKFESRADKNDEALVNLQTVNKAHQENTSKINAELNVLKNKPKSLDRFNVHMQMPKQKPLDD